MCDTSFFSSPESIDHRAITTLIQLTVAEKHCTERGENNIATTVVAEATDVRTLPIAAIVPISPKKYGHHTV